LQLQRSFSQTVSNCPSLPYLFYIFEHTVKIVPPYRPFVTPHFQQLIFHVFSCPYPLPTYLSSIKFRSKPSPPPSQIAIWNICLQNINICLQLFLSQRLPPQNNQWIGRKKKIIITGITCEYKQYLLLSHVLFHFPLCSTSERNK
jgi:hypothetical protein